MKNVTGIPRPNGTAPLSATRQSPLGRLTVDYSTDLGHYSKPLNTVPVETYVSATGTVTAVRLHGTDNAPRATFTLTTSTGDSAIVAVSTERYSQLFGELVEGRTVEVRGNVRRPFRDMPAFLQINAARSL